MQYIKVIGRDYSSPDSPKIMEETRVYRFNGVLANDPERRGYEITFIHEDKETEDE